MADKQLSRKEKWEASRPGLVLFLGGLVVLGIWYVRFVPETSGCDRSYTTVEELDAYEACVRAYYATRR